MHTRDRTALITGATSGIGLIAAKDLARQGYRVLMTARDRAKGQRVLDMIAAETGNSSLELYVGDLARMEDTRRIALEVRARHEAIHILCNNAGGIFLKRQTTVDQFEQTLAVNYLTPFLLTNLLLPTLQATGKSRIINVSSNVHTQGRIKWHDLQRVHGYQGFGAYSQSKLLIMLFTFGLARRLANPQISCIAVHPGVVASAFWDSATPLVRPVFQFIKQNIAITSVEGASALVDAATNLAFDGQTGFYLAQHTVKRAKAIAYDTAVQDRLWDETQRMLEKWLDATEYVGTMPASSAR